MKMQLPLAASVFLSIGLIDFSPFARAATVTLPASAAYPTNTTSNPGFVVRTAQASTNVVVGNSGARALKQIDGTLLDAANNVVTNIAIAGTNANGAYYVDSVNFEPNANLISIEDQTGNVVATFQADFFPGIPGEEGVTTQFATEAVGLVLLEAGTYALGVAVGADRTDVNDDDGYSLFVGANPRDFFATKVADYDRGPIPAFNGDQHVENEIDVVAPVTGVYPFRLLHWQTGHGANLQFYLIDTNTLERILLDDPNDTRSPRVFRDTTGPRYNAPYIAEVSPVPGSAGINSSAPIEIVLFDGSGATLNTGSIQLFLNDVPVTPQVKIKDGNKLTVRYNPDAGRADPNNAVRFLYSDSNGVSYSNQWSFTIITAGGSATTVAGQWDFDFGDLRATVGNGLRYFDPTFDGPNGSNANKTQFGMCSTFGIPLINGQDAAVMRVPGDLDRRIGYVMDHGIAPNGGGTKVNQYTLIMDIMVDSSGPGAASLLQIDSTNNTTDGDLFWQGSNFGQGGGGYNGKGTFTAGAWHRIVAAYDEAANPPVVTKLSTESNKTIGPLTKA